MGGWLATAATVVAADVWLIRHGRNSMSRCFWNTKGRPLAGPFVVGAWAALTWHLVNPPDGWEFKGPGGQ